MRLDDLINYYSWSAGISPMSAAAFTRRYSIFLEKKKPPHVSPQALYVYLYHSVHPELDYNAVANILHKHPASVKAHISTVRKEIRKFCCGVTD